MFGRKKEVKRICKNCKLYDKGNSVCGIVFLMDGEDYMLETKPNDKCHIEENGLINEVKTLGMWFEGDKRFIEYSE